LDGNAGDLFRYPRICVQDDVPTPIEIDRSGERLSRVEGDVGQAHGFIPNDTKTDVKVSIGEFQMGRFIDMAEQKAEQKKKRLLLKVTQQQVAA
jgi:hypothetical protein